MRTASFQIMARGFQQFGGILAVGVKKSIIFIQRAVIAVLYKYNSPVQNICTGEWCNEVSDCYGIEATPHGSRPSMTFCKEK